MANQGTLLVALAEAYGTASGVASSKPVDTRANAAFRGKVRARISRTELANNALANVGGLTIYGSNLPSLQKGTDAQEFRGEDGATGRTVFTSALTYVANSNYNWICILNGTVLVYGSGAGKFQISNSSGVAVCTLGTAAAVGDKLELYYVVPTSLYSFADGEITHKTVDFQGYDMLWLVLDSTATPSLTNCYVTPVAAAA
ncbi:MAG: hypothetical protein EPN91_13185 [Salinibacterium sp.]|nr:MAG: hypothetical protein EPN91_13185 [Salinibacterium sp.]